MRVCGNIRCRYCYKSDEDKLKETTGQKLARQRHELFLTSEKNWAEIQANLRSKDESESNEMTISQDSRIAMHINNGLFNGQPIYIHYTDKNGYEAILNSQHFKASPNKSRRGDKAKTSVYLAQAKDAMDNKNAHFQFFLGEEKYKESATHCFIFSFRDKQYLEPQPVTTGGDVNEVLYPGNIPFRDIDLIYSGINPFQINPFQ